VPGIGAAKRYSHEGMGKGRGHGAVLGEADNTSRLGGDLATAAPLREATG